MQKFLILLFFLLINSSNVISEENDYFLSLKKDKVYVRYGPGKNYPIKYIYKKKFLTIKVIDKKDNYRRIIDHKKNSGWIHISQLKKVNSVISLKDKILFKKPTNFSKPIASIEKGRVLVVQKCENNWCKIKTKKFKGWIKKSDIWGQVN